MRICIYCLGKKALKALEGVEPPLLASIAMIVIGKDKNVVNDYSGEIQQWAAKNNIRFSMRDEMAGSTISYDFHIAIGWRWLLPAGSNQQLIVFHDSLLPKYRGYNPLVTALINGDTEIGATCFLANEGIDTGDIILQERYTIGYPIKISGAIDIMAGLYAAMLNRLLTVLNKNTVIKGISQDEANASYSLWRDEADYRINWHDSAVSVKRFVDATGYPYKGAFFYHNNEKIRVSEVTVLPELTISNRAPGKVFSIADGLPTVVCGEGLLRLDKMTYESGNIFRIQHLRTRL
ncbi:MAG: formyltransferase family protein [Ferruginibacter sp.]